MQNRTLVIVTKSVVYRGFRCFNPPERKAQNRPICNFIQKTVNTRMKVILLFLCLISTAFFGQNISSKDTILLEKFWNSLIKNIKEENKSNLSNLFQFPFYCAPCVEDSGRNKPQNTIKVSKNLLLSNSFKINSLKKILSEPNFEINRFKNYTNENNKIVHNKYLVFYTIVKPNKNWEGSQGIINLQKINGKFKITGIDIIP